MNVLFVCSRNKWRSRTAESHYKKHGQHSVRSAGTEKSARIRLTAALVDWADVIYAMEDKHRRSIIRLNDSDSTKDKIEVLGIEDKYAYMDDELIEILRLQLGDLNW